MVTDPMDCAKCGQTHRGCTSHNRAGNPCGKRPIKGGSVCTSHGGKAPQVKAKAAEREAEAEAVGLLTKHGGVVPVTDPLSELAELAGRAKRLVLVLDDKVDELTRIRFTDDKGSEQLRSEVAVYIAMFDKLRAILVDMLKHGIMERLAKVEEEKARILVDALAAGLRDAGLEDRTPEVVGHVRRHLHVVPEPAAG